MTIKSKGIQELTEWATMENKRGKPVRGIIYINATIVPINICNTTSNKNTANYNR